MRRLASSFFLIVFLFANTELHELVKIGVFIEHYTEHQKQNKDMGLLDFIILHYFSGNIVDDDYAQDMQLPFKTSDCNNPVPTIPIPLPEFSDLPPGVPADAGPLPIYDQSMLPASHTADIWQPPKAC